MSKLFADYEQNFRDAFRPAQAETLRPAAAVDLQPIRDAFKEGFRLQGESKWAEAAKKFEFCIEAFQQVLGEDHEEMVSARGYLGLSYAEMRQFSVAESLWKRCEDISMKRLGPDNAVTLDYMRKLFLVMMDQGDWSRAKNQGESCLKILEKEQSGAVQTLDLILKLGHIYVNLHEYPKALEYHRRALTGMERAVGFKNIGTIDAQFKLGAVYGELGDMKTAEQVYQQNRDICASTRGKTDEAYLRAAVNLGSVQRLGGNDIKAEETLISLLPDTGPNRQDRYWKKYTGRAADELIKLYKELGRHADVQKAEEWINGNPAPLMEVKHSKLQPFGSNRTPRVGEDDEVFNWDIRILNNIEEPKPAVALMDTGCQSGNWVSARLIERLGKGSSVSQDYEPPGIVDVHTRAVEPAGVIELAWKRVPYGNRYHFCRCFVFANVDQFDLLIGVEYIVKEKLMAINDAMVPLLPHQKLNKNSKAAIMLAKEKHRQEKEAHEKQRQAEASQQTQSQTQVPQSQYQQQE